ncbi:hypothetical protein [Phreatobacter stygius]|uniref:Uncharacterized protein n=1 Tax=Phreatobacter stygius TaxID=1940610 RepID=A0A4D7BJC4_9HYPH|nr:hypothetical protein [Phreatobacter stygius]QCI67817.1 hypothetical protein E8M01_28485 [Phreatobacter stygius]
MSRLLNAFRSCGGVIAAGLLVLAGVLPAQQGWAQGAASHAPEPGGVEYGFLNSSDMDKAGTVSLELDTVGLYGRRGRHFASSDTLLNLAYAVTDQVQVAFGPQFTIASVHVVPGLPDVRRALLGGFRGDLRLGLIDRRSNPIGLTLQFTPQWRFADEAVRRGAAHGLAVSLALDRELIAGTLFGTLNLTYEMTHQRIDGIAGWERGSRAGLGLGLAARLSKVLHVGAEFRYLRRHDGFAAGRFHGHAFYLGPTVYAEFGGNWWASLSWQTQIAGHEVGKRHGMDLIGFERHQVRLRVGYDF